MSDWSSDVCSSDLATCPFEKEQLARLEETFEEIETTPPSVDGGLLILQGGKVTWTAPMKLPSDPLSVQLYDRDAAAMALRHIDGATSASLSIDPASPRPKYGAFDLEEGNASASITAAGVVLMAGRSD